MAGLEAALDLVDHIDPALAANQAVGAMAAAQRFQRVTDLHVKNPCLRSKAVLTGRIWQNGIFPKSGQTAWDGGVSMG